VVNTLQKETGIGAAIVDENDLKAVEKTELVDETKPIVNVETSKPNEAQAEAAKTEVKPIELKTEQKEESTSNSTEEKKPCSSDKKCCSSKKSEEKAS
jgi:translation elongation factor P/translation initiation factor 5A